MKTTIQISNVFRRELKTISSMRDVSYEDALEDMVDIFKTLIPFGSEREFADWFEQHLGVFGFRKILEKRTRSSPDYSLESVDGKVQEVELEVIGTDFLRHHHDPSTTDLIICLFSKLRSINGVPVLSIIAPLDEKEEVLRKFHPNFLTISLPRQLSEKIQAHIRGTPFTSLSSYVTFVMRLVLAEYERGNVDTKCTVNKVSRKLKKLGYLPAGGENG